MDSTVDNFVKIQDGKDKEEFRQKVQKFIRFYEYLSQIITFTDVDLEKKFIFLRYLAKKLPKKETEKVDISEEFDLDSLRIQKIHERKIDLIDETGVIDPLRRREEEYQEPKIELFIEIIAQVNYTYGVDLTDDDKVDLERLKEKIFADEVIKMFLNANNTDENKKNIFNEQFDKLMQKFVTDRFEFYRKIQENSGLKISYKKNFLRLLISNTQE